MFRRSRILAFFFKVATELYICCSPTCHKTAVYWYTQKPLKHRTFYNCFWLTRKRWSSSAWMTAGFGKDGKSFCTHQAQNASHCFHGNRKHSALAAYSLWSQAVCCSNAIYFSDWACRPLVVFVCSQEVCGYVERAGEGQQKDRDIKSERETFMALRLSALRQWVVKLLIQCSLYLIKQNAWLSSGDEMF